MLDASYTHDNCKYSVPEFQLTVEGFRGGNWDLKSEIKKLSLTPSVT